MIPSSLIRWFVNVFNLKKNAVRWVSGYQEGSCRRARGILGQGLCRETNLLLDDAFALVKVDLVNINEEMHIYRVL